MFCILLETEVIDELNFLLSLYYNCLWSIHVAFSQPQFDGTRFQFKTDMSGEWAHPIFNCFDDIGICLLAYFAPCVLFGQNNEKMGEGSCVLCGIAFFVPIFNLIQWLNLRGKIREVNAIEGSTLGDCFTILLCGTCALAQETMEVRNIPGLMSMSRE